jgi:hypothetical protein
VRLRSKEQSTLSSSPAGAFSSIAALELALAKDAKAAVVLEAGEGVDEERSWTKELEICMYVCMYVCMYSM